MDGSKFKRRDGTAGIYGQLYETKLLCLLNFRAIHDVTIQDFQLASNIDKIGAFDDICFKATVKGHDKPVCLFIQAKHKENKQQTLKIDWSTYFTSYIKIRQKFFPSKDLFFGCEFDETECYFVIYTNARYECSNDPKFKSTLYSNLHDLIDTGGKYNLENVGKKINLCEIAIKDNMVSLAERIAKQVMGQEKFQMMLTTELMMRYHVILAQKVVNVSKIHPEGIERYRTATFRQDFFNTNDKYLTVFKDTLYKEIVKKRILDPTLPTDNIKSLLTEFLADTTDAEKLSKLIGPVITYNNLDNDVQINKKYTEYVGPQQLNVSPETVKQALELAAKEILLSPKLDLKVPPAFGNKDLSVKKSTTIDYLVSVINDLLDKYKDSKIVTIDDSLGDRFLQLKGGIAGAIGNIFVLDDNPNLMKVTSDENSLGTFAKSLYQRLNDKIKLTNNNNRTEEKIPDVCEYKFRFKFKNCPKLLLEYGEYEDNLAQDFLKKLLIYSGQADEKGVENLLKAKIKDNLPDHSDYLHTKTEKTEQIFFKYHNEILEWWKKSNKVSYLNKSSQIFEKAVGDTIKDPLMSLISVPYMREIKQYNYTFTEDAVSSLNLQDQRSSTIIVTENCVLTIVKVFQYFKDVDYFLLDLASIVKLPTIKERKAVLTELTKTEKEIILVCNNLQNSDDENRTFENIAEAVRNKNILIITNVTFKEILQKYFGVADNNIINDYRTSLIDMSEESQTNILASCKLKVKGLEVRLDHFVNGWTWVPADAKMGGLP